MKTALTEQQNWLSSLCSNIEFCTRNGGKRRVDNDFDWSWFEKTLSYQTKGYQYFLRNLRNIFTTSVHPAHKRSIDWLLTNAPLLWETRSLLEDQTSKLEFDSSIILRVSGHRYYFFRPTDFNDYVSIDASRDFAHNQLPNSYLGIPLREYSISLNTKPEISPIKITCAEGMLETLNKYRQYLIRRENIDLAPKAGDIVLDCGACIGDYSAIFAAIVGDGGQVHAFDPEELHNKYCEIQRESNPQLQSILHFNTLGVGNKTTHAKNKQRASTKINPGLQSTVDSFDFIRIDDYVNRESLPRIDYIKMDIEGAEIDALQGASMTIQKFKPRLAISIYHKPSDFWEIPKLIKSIDSSYKFFFGHHSPTQWESVIYGVSK